MMVTTEKIFSLQPKKALLHFPEDEYLQICQLVSNKINEFKETFAITQFEADIAQKLNELTDVIMNCVEYPKGIFSVQELLIGCQILLQSNDIILVKNAVRFLSSAIYSTSHLSEYISDLFPLIFKITVTDSDIFVKNYFSLLTNIFTDLKNSNNISLIYDILINYYSNIIEYITNLDNFYKEELIFLMILSSYITSERDQEAYSQFTNYLLDLLNDQRISADENYQSIVLWSIYENCKHNPDEFCEIALSLNFFRFLIDSISNYEIFPICCLEPVLIILHITIESQKNASFILENDLPIFLHYCDSSNKFVQFDSLKLTRSIVPYFTSEFLSLNILELGNLFQEIDFKSSKEIFLIFCSLIFYLPDNYLVSDYQVVSQLIYFVVQNINFDDESSIAALQSLIRIKEEFSKRNKKQDFDQIFDDANQNESFDELRDNRSDEILDLIEAFDEI